MFGFFFSLRVRVTVFYWRSFLFPRQAARLLEFCTPAADAYGHGFPTCSLRRRQFFGNPALVFSARLGSSFLCRSDSFASSLCSLDKMGGEPGPSLSACCFFYRASPGGLPDRRWLLPSRRSFHESAPWFSFSKLAIRPPPPLSGGYWGLQ